MYAEQNASPVENDRDKLRELGLELVEANLLQKGPNVRHNPAAIGAVALDLARRGRARRNLP
jgi:hypothetical protein